MSIELNMFQGHMMTAKDDAVVYEPMMTGNGILHGCEITFLGANQVHIEAGDGIIKGRKFTILEETINVQLPEEDGLPGRIYIRMDLSDTEEPIKIISTCHSTTLPDLEQDEECNYTNGVYEIELATYTGNRTAITDLISTYTVVSGMWKQIKKDVEETNNSLISDIYVGEDGKLHKVQGGADSVLPFSSIPKSGTVFTTSGVNLQEYFPNTWQKLRTSDFVCGVTSVSGTSQVGREDKSTGYNGSFSFSSDAVSVNYDSTTGILTFGSFSSTRGTKSWAYWNGGNNQNTVNVSGNNPFCAWKGTYSG